MMVSESKNSPGWHCHRLDTMCWSAASSTLGCEVWSCAVQILEHMQLVALRPAMPCHWGTPKTQCLFQGWMTSHWNWVYQAMDITVCTYIYIYIHIQHPLLEKGLTPFVLPRQLDLRCFSRHGTWQRGWHSLFEVRQDVEGIWCCRFCILLACR